MLTLSLESNDREPGTIYRSLICKENPPNNRSQPTTGNDSTRERFMTAPALALIVPTRSIVPGREPGSRERFTHLGGSSTVMVVTVVLYYSVRRRDGHAHHHRPNQRERSMRLRMSSARQTVVLLPSLMPWGNLPSRIPAHQAERLMGIRDRICGNRTKPVSGRAGRGWYMASIRGRLGMLCIECHKNRHS